jgi:hypothetical protein
VEGRHIPYPEISLNLLKHLQSAIRDFWRSTYNTRTPKDFANYVSAPTDLVAAVQNGATLPDDTIQLDFSRGYEQSRWNSLVLTRHCEAILDSRVEDGGWGLPDVSEGYLLGLFHGHLKRSREGWAKVKSRFCEETGRLETNEETHQRLSQEDEIRYATVASRSRRQTVSIPSFSSLEVPCTHPYIEIN